MATPVLIIGESGSGKSAAIRNFERSEVGIFAVASKPLPFRKEMDVVKHATYNVMYTSWERAKANGRYRKAYVIDDSQYLMTFAAFSRAKENGYGKFTDFALDFYNLIQYVINDMPDDVIVYFLHHMERTDTGAIKAKTLGKMLDSQLTLEGLFSIVLYCQTDGVNHWFVTQSDGYTTAKSPMDMFPVKIDNDLKLVDTAIRDYYGFDNNENKEANENA